MALAGLWEMWRSPTGETVRSFTVIKTEPWPSCLGEEPATTGLQAMLMPFQAAGLSCWPVSKLVDNVKSSEPSLVEPELF